MKRYLEEEDRSAIVNGMRVAAERYREHTEELREMIGGLSGSNVDGLRRLAEQFRQQQTEALSLAETIEQAERIVIEE